MIDPAIGAATQTLVSTNNSPAQTGSDFSKVLENSQKQEHMMSQMMDTLQPGAPFDPNQHTLSASDLNVPKEAIAPVENQGVGDRMGGFLSEVNRGQLQMESIMELTTSGRKFNTTELLAMQAGVYQITHEMELTTKVFESVNTFNKTLLNTNFQG